MRNPVRLVGALLRTLRAAGPAGALARTREYLSVKLRQLGRTPLPSRASAVRLVDPLSLPRSRYRPPEPGRPVISVLMPVHETPPDILRTAIESVLRQTYDGWELCICDDASRSAETRAVLDEYRGFDPRLKITRSETPLHIAGATNAAAAFATGDFVGFLDHDDVLTPDALQAMAEAIEAKPEADVLYSDEDKIEPDGRLSEPYLKPDWSPEHLTSAPYLLHLMLVRKRLFLELGGLREAYSGAQDYDLSLRATARARRVVHVPKVLYHWRKIAGSAAAVVDAKPEALEAGRRAALDFVRSVDPAASVGPGLLPGAFRALWPVDPARPVTLAILTAGARRELPGRGDTLLVLNTVRSISERSTFANRRVLVLNNGDLPAAARAEMTALGAEIVDDQLPTPFNFPDKLAAAFPHVETEDVVLLNDDLEVVSPDWLEALLAHSRREEVGAVGARLLYPDDRIQHAGVVLGVCGPTTHIFHNLPASTPGYNGYTHLVRNYSAVTGAVMATRMSLLHRFGGFDRRFAIDYNDVDYCLRLGEAGLRVVYTPFATLHHFEGSSLQRKAASASDQAAFVERWGERLGRDPFYNPGLPVDRTDCAVARW